ncbi:MAG TPA: DNA-formamidopyrimidine glycosylase family protein, partial [Bacillota bacterium]|nr:DNA-formamidopyrimidine glycosylase family protein [Bacillota bacterium]
MPELPEVEVLVRHLAPLLTGKTVRSVEVRRPKILAPTSPDQLAAALINARFVSVTRRAKFLVLELRRSGQETFQLLGHLGMTGRMYLLPAKAEEPKHVAVALGLGRLKFIFEDTRYFGRFTLDTRALVSLGPEPLSDAFTTDYFAAALRRSTQPIKVKLLDQGLVAGIGNIYASEALFRAGIAPQLPARRVNSGQVLALWQAIREVLQ